MALIEPSRREIINPSQIKKHSASLRFWHWTNALIICGSLLTVLLNSTLFDVRDNAAYIQKQLKDSGATVNEEQARNVAHGLEDKVWSLHIYFGYALVALLLFRLTSELINTDKPKFLRKLKLTYAAYKNSRRDNTAKHDLIVKLLYLTFYILITVMAITGICLAFDDVLGIGKSLSHSIKEVHGFCMYLIIAFILVHVIGVLLAERKDSKGIVSDMIHGGEIN
ncbi:MAG: cytochrome b/b6 domain-containing protein [Chitinophagaceae bacterium]|nr:MAG: cytochrome b/b6 domain-containing protein [Chitinophagaceae bacterium]